MIITKCILFSRNYILSLKNNLLIEIYLCLLWKPNFNINFIPGVFCGLPEIKGYNNVYHIFTHFAKI